MLIYINLLLHALLCMLTIQWIWRLSACMFSSRWHNKTCLMHLQDLPTTCSNSALLICASLMLTVSSCLTSPNRKPSWKNKLKQKLSFIKQFKTPNSDLFRRTSFMLCIPSHVSFIALFWRMYRNIYQQPCYTLLVRNEAKPAGSSYSEGQAYWQSLDKR